MRVLHVIGSLQTGGAETALTRLCLASHGKRLEHQILVLGRTGPLEKELQKAGVRVRGLAGWMVEERPEIVHGWMYHGSLAATLLQAWLHPSAALAWNIRSGLDHPEAFKPLTRSVVSGLVGLSRRPGAIVYNAASARHQHESAGFSSPKGVVIPNGFDLQHFRKDPSAAWRLRAELGISSGDLILGLVGRIHPEKNPGLFLEVLDRLPSAFHGVLVGPGATRENSLLRPWLAKSPLANRIHLLGERTDMPQILSGLDLCVSTSWNEGFSNVLGEAMCCETLCVATAVGDSPLLLGSQGRLVPPGDAATLAEAILSLLGIPGERRIDLGALGRARMKDHFSLGHMVGRYEVLYGELAGRL